MIIYLFLLVSIAIPDFLFNNRKLTTEKYIYIVVYIMLATFVASFRDMIGGYDIYIYKSYFDSVGEFGNYYNYELGYYYSNLLLSSLDFEFSIFVFVSSTLILISTFSMVSIYSRLSFLALLILFAKFYLMSYVYIRQGIAMGVAWYSLVYLFKDERLKYISILVLASFFHLSALIFAVTYFCYRKPFSKKIIVSLFTITFLLGLTPLISYMTSFIGDVSGISKLSKYGGNQGGINFFYILEAFGLAFLAILTTQFKVFFTKKQSLFFNLFVVYVATNLLVLRDATALRYSWYYLIGLAVAIPHIIEYIKNKPTRMIIKFSVVLYFSALFIRTLLIWDGGDFSPYKSIFQDFDRNGRWEHMG